MKPSTRMAVQKYMDDRRYEESDRRRRNDPDMREYNNMGDMRRYPRYDGNMTTYYPDTEPMDNYPSMRRGRSSRTGRYISNEYEGYEPNMRVYEEPSGYSGEYRDTRMGFMPDDRRQWPTYPNMHHDGYDFNVQGSIADMGYGHATGKLVPMPQQRMTRKVAEEWAEEMENCDGSQGPRWSYEEVKKAMEERHVDCDPNEFYVILNSVYSDYCSVAKKFGADKLEFYIDLAKAWIDDKDAVPNKAMMYYRYVVKH